eukprot:scaffold32912_cov45-Prasinocladus_malaysianus.AAC.1
MLLCNGMICKPNQKHQSHQNNWRLTPLLQHAESILDQIGAHAAHGDVPQHVLGKLTLRLPEVSQLGVVIHEQVVQHLLHGVLRPEPEAQLAHRDDGLIVVDAALEGRNVLEVPACNEDLRRAGSPGVHNSARGVIVPPDVQRELAL